MADEKTYVLTVEVRGPYHRDEFSIASFDRETLRPKVVEHHGHPWERYEEDEGYIEVRAEHIVSRRLRVSTATSEMLKRIPSPSSEIGDMP